MDGNDSSTTRVVKLVALGLLTLGVVVRFINLDLKIYGSDETATLVHVAGFTRPEAFKQLFNGQEIGADDIQKFQRPNDEKTLMDTVRSLASETPQLTPLYFILARLWAESFGNSARVTKSLPALLSLFLLPCVYWLCRELFGSPIVGWITTGLIAISPFHVLYAQEARPYSLLAVATMLSSAALLYGVRMQTKLGWTAYSATVALGLYSHLCFGFVLVGHAIYMLITERARFSRSFNGFAVSLVGAAVLFAPWLLIVLAKFSVVEQHMSWTAVTLRPFSVVKAWAGDFSRLFFDLGRMGSDFTIVSSYWDIELLGLIGSSVLAFSLAFYALAFLWRNASKQMRIFVFALIGAASLPLIAADVTLGRRFSMTGRYLIPAYLGIQLAISYCLAAKITGTAGIGWHHAVWRLAGVVLALSGLLSCFVVSQSPVWWNHPHVYYDPRVARIVNQSTRPLLISDATGLGNIFSLSYALHPNARFQLLKTSMPAVFAPDLFLYRPSDALLEKVEIRYRLEAVYLRGRLWRVITR